MSIITDALKKAERERELKNEKSFREVTLSAKPEESFIKVSNAVICISS